MISILDTSFGKGIFFLLALIFITACSDEQGSASLPGQEKIVARVEGSTISEFDMQRALEQTLGQGALALISNDDKKRLLDSLILNRLMALQVEQEIQPEEQARIEHLVGSFRESLLAKLFIQKHADAQMITDDMIESYYRDNPERFGARDERYFEMLKGPEQGSENEQELILGLLKAAPNNENWDDYSHQVKVKNSGIIHYIGKFQKGGLPPRLMTVVHQLNKHEISPVIYFNQTAYRLRVTSIERVNPKPLTEVKPTVEKILRSKRIEKFLSENKKQLFDGAHIEYLASNLDEPASK